jgi:pimeloyl-ACP methyl ester carboxylesterase
MIRVLVVTLAGLALIPAAAVGQAPRLVTEGYHVPARDPGVELYVRNTRPADMTRFTPERIALFVHGATYPAETSFDLPLDGLSWMQWIARRGFDVYLMDVRGYGRSTRPPEMSAPASANPPIVATGVAMADVAAVVDHIRTRRGVPRITLIGWSWGTVLTGAYTARYNDTVERLVLYAPLWLLTGPPRLVGDGPLGAYRTVTMDAARQRWIRGVPAEKLDGLIPAGWFEAWWAANLESDPVGAAQSPPVVRAPNGVVEDLRRYWGAGTPYYDPGTITVPVLLIHADWDADTPAHMAQAVFARLPRARRKRYVVVGEGTHSILMEKNRLQLFREVQLFLEEPR